jgi:hypothetical protein
MGGLRERIPPKDGSLDGGLEWCHSQFHLQPERELRTVVDTLKREEVIFNKLRGRMVFYFTETEFTYNICKKGSSKTLSLHLLVQQLKALELVMMFI